MSQNILVTGGEGFIGSHIVDRLLAEGNFVTVLANFDPYYDPKIKRKNIEAYLTDENFRIVEGDVRDYKLISGLLKEMDFVFHEAAQAGVRASVEDPMKPHSINVNGTLNILKASLDTGVKKIINASSSSVYGKAIELPFKENSPKHPVSPYGVSKLAAELYCRNFYELYGLKTTSLRYFTVYGPRMRPDLAISIFTKKALKNENIEIFGTGKKTRDFTYVEDVVDANIKSMSKGDGEQYNIGRGRRISINELAEKIITLTDSNSKIIHTGDQKGDAEHTWADISKAKKGLGWQPKTSIEKGLRKYVDYIKCGA